ncbi:hypothetical protein [Geoalkalibacter sp.]|uniref:hypothetical protein n=1 Tax=Geoalkalibacter sp. TaxID=3041440 RepID=UPI00272EA4F0|nr:hypothetical protein [Geoalkalibacter sp.]
MTETASETIHSDILLVVGGNFTPDHLGPEGYAVVAARLRAAPEDYLSAFEKMFIGENFDALNLSRLHPVALLKQLAGTSPSRVRQTAERLLKQLDAVLVVYDAASDKQALSQLLPESTMRLSQRLDQCRRELEEFTR